MTTRTHAQQFANQELPRTLFGDPLAFIRALANPDTQSAFLASLWEQAGAQLAPIARIPGGGLGAKLDRRGLYTIAIVTLPPPRESGEPVMVAIIGRGDGVSKLATIAYFVLEVAFARATGAPSYSVVTRTQHDEKGTSCGEGPLPDPMWLAEHVWELYAGRTPAGRSGTPTLPNWYWWYTLDGAAAMRAFNAGRDSAERIEVLGTMPVLLLPEIAEIAELFIGAPAAKRLRELRALVRRAPSLATSWANAVQLLINTGAGSQAANTLRALDLVGDAAAGATLTRPQACELEATVRSKLAALNIDAHDNRMRAEQLIAEAWHAQRGPRMARGSAAPPITGEDPVWRPLFLDESDLPDSKRGERDEVFSAHEPTFVAHGGMRAGYAAWVADDCSPISRLFDARWVFPTSAAAAYFLRAATPMLGDGFMPLPSPSIGDETLAFGGELATDAGPRRAQIVVVRVGRVVARLYAIEGAYAARARQILHPAVLHPYALRVAQRARQGLAAYWLAVAYPTNAVAALVHSPGHDAARLLEKYPLLAHPELPAAMTSLGDSYAVVARSLASFQAQVRAHRWATYQRAMRGLVRMLLDTDMGDPRVNAAQAFEIVSELRHLDPDPIWHQLDAECRARA